MSLSQKDRTLLRDLAAQVAELAARPVHQETIALWKANNGLRPVRPMVMIDQICWHEMDVDGQLVSQLEPGPWRWVEDGLRRTLYSWKHMRADMVIEPFVEISPVIRGLDFGVQTDERVSVLDPQNSVVGHAFIDQFEKDEDLNKIKNPVVELDTRATAEARGASPRDFRWSARGSHAAPLVPVCALGHSRHVAQPRARHPRSH